MSDVGADVGAGMVMGSLRFGGQKGAKWKQLVNDDRQDEIKQSAAQTSTYSAASL